METDNSSTEHETLGDLFRRLRLERSLDINDVAQETRIPPKTIRAMETDAYDQLPAPAFARGFYSLYAQMLELDQDEIVQRYYEERSENSTTKSFSRVPPPSWQHKNIGTMAERPSLTPSSIIGSALLVLILLTAGIFWYIGFNPATHVSKWLRDFQEDPVAEEQQMTPSDQPESATGTGVVEEQPFIQPPTLPQGEDVGFPRGKYQLAAEFPYNTLVSITIDDGVPQNLEITADTIETWHAEKHILLELPPQTKAELYLNGELLTLPAAVDNKITIRVPE